MYFIFFFGSIDFSLSVPSLFLFVDCYSGNLLRCHPIAVFKIAASFKEMRVIHKKETFYNCYRVLERGAATERLTLRPDVESCSHGS